jgi:hypothetical protein
VPNEAMDRAVQLRRRVNEFYERKWQDDGA